MITTHGERLVDYYKLKWNFNSDNDIEKKVNKIVEEKQNKKIKDVIAESICPSKKLYLITYLQNANK